MALDYIIGALQLLSASVNVLALGSFWITPGLRTTANRFVINLLVVNIVGCLALTPALWLNGGLVPEVHSETQPIYDDESSITNNNGGRGVTVTTVPTPYHDASLNSHHVNFGGVSSTIKSTLFVEIIEQSGDTDGLEIIADIHSDADMVKTEEKNQTDFNKPMNRTRSAPTEKNVRYSDCTRFWGFDLVAALGKIQFIYTLLMLITFYLLTYCPYCSTYTHFDLIWRKFNATLWKIIFNRKINVSINFEKLKQKSYFYCIRKLGSKQEKK